MAEGVILKDTLNSHWKENKNGFGFRMLEKMGWTSEKGLGKNEDGMSDAVKVKRREDGLGLGMENVVDDKVGSKAWSSTISSFNSVLELLKNNYRPNEAEEDNSDDDKQKKKKQKKEKKEPSEKKDRQIFTVGLKYKKFRDAKTMSGRSLAEKQAIFGHGHVNQNSVTTVKTESSSSIRHEEDKDVEVKVSRRITETVTEDVESIPGSDSSSSEKKEKKMKKEKKVKKNKKEKKQSKKRPREESDDE